MCEWRTIARSPVVRSALNSARRLGGVADGEEVEGALQAALAQGEVRGRDRRREALVEGLGQVQALVDAVPARAQRHFVQPQPASVEQSQQLDPGKVRLAERAELRCAVLA